MKTINYALKHINKWRLGFILIAISIIFAQIFTSLTSVRFKDFVNALTQSSTTKDQLISIVIAILVLDAISRIVYRLSEFVADILFPKVMASLREEAFLYMHKHSYKFFSENFSGSLVKKINRYVDGFNNGIEKILFSLLHTVARVVVSLVIIYSVNQSVFFLSLGWTLAFTVLNFFFSKYKYKFDVKVNLHESKISGYHSDAISNQFNISIFNTLNYEKKRFLDLLNTWKKLATKSWLISDTINAFQGALMVGINIVILIYGVFLWEKSQLSIGDFVLIQAMLSGIFNHLWDFGRNLRHLARAFSDMSEMVEILETPHEVRDKEGSVDLNVEKGVIEFKNLEFSYPKGNSIFNDFNLQIEDGKKIALVSKSGQGKSTLVKLLLRLFNVPEDSILIDNQDIMKVTQSSLRGNISLVPQEPVLFHRTLAENIAYARPDSTMEEIIEASKKAHCHEFILNLKDGYDTFVGERGIKLSGGERQRIAIARAFIENAPILVLDEATSSLDSESEHFIQTALKDLMKGKTVIVIAHRLSTIKMMDEILILENGKIVERGSHDQLLNKPGSTYKKLWEIQAGGFIAEEV